MKKIGLIVLIGFLASLTIAGIDTATTYMPPFTVTTLRLTIASTVFGGIFYFLRPNYHWHARGVTDMVLISLLNIGLPFVALATGLRFVSGSISAVLLNTTPIFTLVMAHFLLADEKLTPLKIVGAAIAVAGATILLLSNSTGLAEPSAQGWLGQALIIFASFSSALGVIYTRLRLRQENVFVVAGGQVMASLILIAPLAFYFDGFPTFSRYAWQGWAGVTVAALCGPVAIFWLVFYMINQYSASLAGFAGIATPFFSILIGVLFLGEVLTVPFAIGSLCLVVGVWSLQSF
ncbi:MAG: DMT family transporter [Anaerolineales bacterium]|nr:DMT family transporter [Anaerolineales bacterium]